MPPPARLHFVRPLSVGGHARAALAASGSARAIAVFERSAYLETPAGLACIGVAAIGNGPLNALLERFPAGVAVGDAFECDLTAAAPWAPRPPPRWDPQSVAAGLSRLGAAVCGRLPAEGFGYTLDAGAAVPQPIAALARWIANVHAESAEVPECVAPLIGLGPGLTPAGDDLIGGVLCALHAAGRSATAARLADWVLPLAATGTSRISRAHLACAAQGECGEAVNDAIVALLSGELPDLARIDAIGHTSGWDALAGAVLALRALQKS